MESIKEQLHKQVTTPSFQQKYQALVERTLAHPKVKAFIEKERVPQAVVAKSYAKLFEFVQELDNIATNGFSQNKGFEPELTLVNHYIDIVYKPTQAYLIAQEEQMIKSRIQTIDMPKNIKQLTLENVDFSDERYEVLDFMSEFSSRYPNESKGAYIFGSYGVGKTFLLGALAGTLAKKGVSSVLVHFPSLVVSLKSAIATNRVQEEIDFIKKAAVLMLDDIGGENMTPWVRDDVLMIILDYRMREQLPTFFTSNLSFDTLKEHLKGTTIEDERKAVRLLERFKALCHVFQVNGANRR